jgi:hypothetical protein
MFKKLRHILAAHPKAPPPCQSYNLITTVMITKPTTVKTLSNVSNDSNNILYLLILVQIRNSVTTQN